VICYVFPCLISKAAIDEESIEFSCSRLLDVTVLALARAALFPIRLGWRGSRALKYLSMRVALYSCFPSLALNSRN
jgi:hypothetical protein